MAGLSLEHGGYNWSLTHIVGYESPLLDLNGHTIRDTWILLIIIFFVSAVIRYILTKDTPLKYALIHLIKSVFSLVEQSIGYISLTHTSFIGTLFIFISLANILSLIPGVEEPTTDLNTTLALGFISFLYTQCTTIYMHGFGNYIKGYFKPFFIMLPLNIIGKISSVASLSFRLFGNIFSGAIISSVYFGMLSQSWVYQIIGLCSTNILILGFFTLFEGFLQALVFTMLSLTYLSIALSGEEH